MKTEAAYKFRIDPKYDNHTESGESVKYDKDFFAGFDKLSGKKVTFFNDPTKDQGDNKAYCDENGVVKVLAKAEAGQEYTEQNPAGDAKTYVCTFIGEKDTRYKKYENQYGPDGYGEPTVRDVKILDKPGQNAEIDLGDIYLSNWYTGATGPWYAQWPFFACEADVPDDLEMYQMSGVRINGLDTITNLGSTTAMEFTYRLDDASTSGPWENPILGKVTVPVSGGSLTVDHVDVMYDSSLHGGKSLAELYADLVPDEDYWDRYVYICAQPIDYDTSIAWEGNYGWEVPMSSLSAEPDIYKSIVDENNDALLTVDVKLKNDSYLPVANKTVDHYTVFEPGDGDMAIKIRDDDASICKANNSLALHGAKCDNIGGSSEYNLAGGNGTVVQGKNSISFGSLNTSNGNNNASFGFGNKVYAVSSESIVAGLGNKVSGKSTAVFGASNEINASNTIVAGSNNKAIDGVAGAFNSAIFGENNKAENAYSLTSGSNSENYGICSIGNNNYVENNGVAIGRNLKVKVDGVALGHDAYTDKNTIARDFIFARPEDDGLARNQLVVGHYTDGLISSGNIYGFYVNGIGGFNGRNDDDRSLVVGADLQPRKNPLTNQYEHNVKSLQEVIELMNARIQYLEDVIEQITVVEP